MFPNSTTWKYLHPISIKQKNFFKNEFLNISNTRGLMHETGAKGSALAASVSSPRSSGKTSGRSFGCAVKLAYYTCNIVDISLMLLCWYHVLKAQCLMNNVKEICMHEIIA